MQDYSSLLLGRQEHPLEQEPDLRRGFEIETVYSGSPAETAGLKPGMVYLTENPNMRLFEPGELSERGATGPIASNFWSPQDKTLVQLMTKGFPHGVRLVPTVERLCEQREYFPDVSKWYVHRALDGPDGDLQLLAEAARDQRTSWHPIAVSMRWATRLALALYDRESLAYIGTQNRILEAAHAAENGQAALARKLQPVEDYEIIFANGTGAASLYYYTEALIAEAEGADPDTVLEMLHNAYGILSSGGKRIAHRITTLSGTWPEGPAAAASRAMASDYVFPEHDPLQGPLSRDVRRISLFKSLEAIRNDQFAILILLGGYRCNGYYDPLMGELSRIYPLLGDRFPIVHVITAFDAETSRPIDPMWMHGETHARDIGVPIRLLFDPTHSIDELLPTNYSPHCVIVDSHRQIVSEGSLDLEDSLWRAVSRA